MMTNHLNQTAANSALVVLVVEDQALIRMDTAEELRSHGWTVYEAANADDAVEQLRTHDEISVLFTDIDMPGSMDGLQLSRLAREECKDMKIVVTSGMHMPSREDLPRDAVFVPKPYNIANVETVIQAS